MADSTNNAKKKQTKLTDMFKQQNIARFTRSSATISTTCGKTTNLPTTISTELYAGSSDTTTTSVSTQCSNELIAASSITTTTTTTVLTRSSSKLIAARSDSTTNVPTTSLTTSSTQSTASDISINEDGTVERTSHSEDLCGSMGTLMFSYFRLSS